MSLKELLTAISGKLQEAGEQLKQIAENSRDKEAKMQVTINNLAQNPEEHQQNQSSNNKTILELILLIVLFLIAIFLFWQSGENRNSLELAKTEKENQEKRIKNLESKIDSLVNRRATDTATRIIYIRVPFQPHVPNSNIEIHNEAPLQAIDSSMARLQSLLTELADSVNSQHRDLSISVNDLIKANDHTVDRRDWLAVRLALDNLLQRLKSQKPGKQRRSIIGENDIKYLRQLTDSLEQNQ